MNFGIRLFGRGNTASAAGELSTLLDRILAGPDALGRRASRFARRSAVGGGLSQAILAHPVQSSRGGDRLAGLCLSRTGLSEMSSLGSSRVLRDAARVPVDPWGAGERQVLLPGGGEFHLHRHLLRHHVGHVVRLRHGLRHVVGVIDPFDVRRDSGGPSGGRRAGRPPPRSRDRAPSARAARPGGWGRATADEAPSARW